MCFPAAPALVVIADQFVLLMDHDIDSRVTLLERNRSRKPAETATDDIDPYANHTPSSSDEKKNGRATYRGFPSGVSMGS